MIEKIISSARSGAERAALDASIKLGLAYGGWIPKEELSGDSILTDKYNLIELPTTSPMETLKRNIRASDGTLVLSHGKLKGDSEQAQKLIRRYTTPLLHVDLNHTNAFNAASQINDWIAENDLSVLHVTGPSEQEDVHIYKAVLDILQAVYFLNLTETGMNPSMGTKGLLHNTNDNLPVPTTIEEAVDIVISEMHLKDRTLMANLKEAEISPLQLTLGLYIKQKLDGWLENRSFVDSCEAAAEKEKLDKSNIPLVLIKLIWKNLRATHRLRIVK